MQIQDALVHFLLQLEADGRSPHTIGQYRRHVGLLRRWARDVGHTGEIETITHETLARFLASPCARTRPDGETKRAGSTNCLRSSIKGYFSYCCRAGYLAQDPSSLVRRAICGTPPPRALSKDEQRRLLKMLAADRTVEGKRDQVMFRLMLMTGIRLGSALGLDLCDVDLDVGELVLRTAKQNRPDLLRLDARAKKLLAGYLRRRAAGPLFSDRHGRRLSPRHVQRRFSQWLAKAGVMRAASPHSLRHSFAVGLYQKTRDVLAVKEALRHRSIGSTLIYAGACAAARA
jgi:site-specific recombinase XerC